ncbi:hypothetical protein M7I_3207 [Glarea lozoyensis 74030]|uniref:NB-ARC domain-containing protein n=1 Tax=Glarea lozoyensis (strain ATCC 74030 / MF5533) TaxID=1104152 RepID=H0EKX3_GLAL7|nr:hypothetical protein M7I_3207 [Glarea lozoyensis 74030]
MCKFETKNSPGWSNVASNIKTWVEGSGSLIEMRLMKDKEERARFDQNRAMEMMHPRGVTTIDTTSHQWKYPRRAEGTSAISIQSIPGGGKTHLAREYVYTHKSSYPGGIFWVGAKSEEELVAGYWDIATKAVFKDVASREGRIALRHSEEWVGLVKEWLNNHHDWLLVLDGIHFNESEALRKYIPDSENTSLIYTSTEKGIAGDQFLMNPQMIRLPALSAREAQELFLLELGLTALDVEVKTMDSLNGMDLNNTFRYLNMFALMDRNEQEAVTVGSSQTSRGSRDLIGDNVDFIRLHGVIQAFFTDTLDADQTLPRYLYRAVMVFCESYKTAAERIARKTNAGLVEDYRVYEIHGKRLLHHITKYKKKYPLLNDIMIEQVLTEL